jgi:hypothetical protein
MWYFFLTKFHFRIWHPISLPEIEGYLLKIEKKTPMIIGDICFDLVEIYIISFFYYFIAGGGSKNCSRRGNE